MKRHIVTTALGGLVLAGTLFAQGNPTGTITGSVSSGGEPLPGVRITATSPSLQQARQVFSQPNGGYKLGALPPGDYRVTFELEGMETQSRRLDVAAAQVGLLDVDMAVRMVTEEIVVTGDAGAISEGTDGSVTLDQDLVEKLAVARTIASTVDLAPGTAATGPNGGISISGSQSSESLFLINGVPVNENLRGQPSDLFIEDAIQETTVTASGVSAEYGRFTGGVVNTITKSGGNELHGSLRDSLTNEDWTSTTPFGESKEDKVNDTYEATLGGRLLKDRIWFFLAGRDLSTKNFGETRFSNFQFDTSQDERRLEGKLTFSLTPSHQLLLSAVDISDDRTGNVQGNGALDLGAVNNDVSFPEESFAGNYVGILGNNTFVEAQHSERSLSFHGIGGTDNDLRSGTPFLDSSRGAVQYHQPIFCGNCPNPDTRKTEHTIAKGSYFLSTAKGSHDLVFGVDTFNDIRSGDNTQSATGFEVWTTSAIIRGNQVFPQAFPFANSFIIQRPILESSLGTSFVSNAAFVNDRWQLGEHWSFNLGVRYDENDGEDSAGNKVSNDSNWSPRLGATFDVKGDGDLLLHATAGRYITRLANTVADSSSAAGNPAFFGWSYGGPAINPDADAADLVSADEALDIIFDWFDAVGGTGLFPDLGVNIPGATSRIDGSLKSPNADELTLGVTKRLGHRGLVRADLVHRVYGDFYLRRTDTTTGTIVDGNGDLQDLTLVVNDSSLLERRYDGLQTVFQYRLRNRLSLGGNWTWSHAYGNFNGETGRSGPVAGTVGQYPEYSAFPQFNPRRDLGVDQRHKLRAWAVWDAIASDHNNLSVALLQSYFSGQSYGVAGAVDTRPFVDVPSYQTPPTSVTYWFTSPDAFKTDDVTRTDLSLNYSFLWSIAGKRLEVFLQPEVLNVFDEHAVVGVNTADVLDETSDPGYATFNPFTDTPVRGVHWDLGPSFGQPRDENDYQAPRTFRFSVGFRF